MTRRWRRCWAKMAFAVITGDTVLASLAEPFSVHPTQITAWKQQLFALAADVFGGTNVPTDSSSHRRLSC